MLSKIACIAVATTAADALKPFPNLMTANANAISGLKTQASPCMVLSQTACQNHKACHWNQFPRDAIGGRGGILGDLPWPDLLVWPDLDAVTSLVSPDFPSTTSHCADGPDFLSAAQDKFNCRNGYSAKVSRVDCSSEDSAYSKAFSYLLDRAPRKVLFDHYDQPTKQTGVDHENFCVQLGGQENMCKEELAGKCPGKMCRESQVYYNLVTADIWPNGTLEKASTDFEFTGPK